MQPDKDALSPNLPAHSPAIASIIERLRTLLPQVVAGLSPGEPIFSVVLAYDCEGSGQEPPLIGVGLESERETWLGEYGSDAQYYIWNPAEYRNFDLPELTLADPALLEAYRQLGARDTPENDPSAEGRSLLNQVANALNQLDWTEYLEVTQDFVVFAVDLEGGDLEENLEAALTPERFEALRSQGLPCL